MGGHAPHLAVAPFGDLDFQPACLNILPLANGRRAWPDSRCLHQPHSSGQGRAILQRHATAQWFQLFAVHNQQAVSLDLIWVELPAASLSMWLLFSLAVGVVLGMVAMTGMYLRLRTLLTRAQRRNQQQRKELDQLRIQEIKEVA